MDIEVDVHEDSLPLYRSGEAAGLYTEITAVVVGCSRIGDWHVNRIWLGDRDHGAPELPRTSPLWPFVVEALVRERAEKIDGRLAVKADENAAADGIVRRSRAPALGLRELGVHDVLAGRG